MDSLNVQDCVLLMFFVIDNTYSQHLFYCIFDDVHFYALRAIMRVLVDVTVFPILYLLDFVFIQMLCDLHRFVSSLYLIAANVVSKPYLLQIYVLFQSAFTFYLHFLIFFPPNALCCSVFCLCQLIVLCPTQYVSISSFQLWLLLPYQ